MKLDPGDLVTLVGGRSSHHVITYDRQSWLEVTRGMVGIYIDRYSSRERRPKNEATDVLMIGGKLILAGRGMFVRVE